LGYYFSQKKFRIKFDQGLSYILGDFSQTHLVTLHVSQSQFVKKIAQNEAHPILVKINA
jgi:hypothetical protein